MPHRVNQWNYTDRGSATCHNDTYRGKSNGTYQASNMRSNQGFASVIATFPQGSFATCRYPDTPEMQRSEAENTWHPQFPGVAETPATLPTPPYNTTGTKPLPIPFNQRPGYEEEERKAAEAAHAKYLAFKALRVSSSEGDTIPADFHEHTIHSAVHIATAHKPGEVFRPSKPRVGTTPLERAQATQKLAQEQAELEATGRAQAAAAEQSYSSNYSHDSSSYIPAAVDPTRAARTQGQQPTHYNIPARTMQFEPARF